MACKYKYNNNWYSKEELQSILYKERGIDKYGKLVKPEINVKNREGFKVYFTDAYGNSAFSNPNFNTREEAQAFIDEKKDTDISFKIVPNKGIQPTQTNATLKESIESIGSKFNTEIEDSEISSEEFFTQNGWTYTFADWMDENEKFSKYKFIDGQIKTEYISKESFNQAKEEYLSKGKKEYTSQALINTKIAALKEVAKKYPRSLIRSEVKKINTSSSSELYDQFGKDELPFQRIPKELITKKLYENKKSNYLTNNESFLILKKKTSNKLKNFLDGDTNTKPSEEKPIKETKSDVIKKLQDVMTSLGIKTEQLEVIFNKQAEINKYKILLESDPTNSFAKSKIKELEKEGVDKETEALVDITNKLIQFSQGNYSDINFTEEAVHVLVDILENKNPELYDLLKGQIWKYKIYKSTLDAYKNDAEYQKNGKTDIDKIKKEAVGKLFSQILHADIPEEENDVTTFEKYVNKALEYIKGLFRSLPIEKAYDFINAKNELFNITPEDSNNLQNSGVFKKRKDFRAITQKLKSVIYDIVDFKTNEEMFNKFKQDSDNTIIEEKIGKDGKPILKDNGIAEKVYSKDGKTFERVSSILDYMLNNFFKNKTSNEEAIFLAEAKATKGTEMHTVLESIMKRLVDVNTGLKNSTVIGENRFTTSTNMLGKTFKSYNIDGVNIKGEVYDKLEKYATDLINSYPTNTRFAFEMKIINAKEGYAGTIDFVAFLPDMRVDILDYKSHNPYYYDSLSATHKTKGDINTFSQRRHRKQLELYKNAINSYSQNVVEFRNVHTVPIATLIIAKKIDKDKPSGVNNTELTIEAIEISGADFSKETRLDLLPVSIKKQSTNNERLDGLIEKLWIAYEKLENKRYPEAERNKKSLELDSMLKGIRLLQLTKNADFMVNLFDSNFLRFNKFLSYEIPWLKIIEHGQKELTSEQDAELEEFLKEADFIEDFLKTFEGFSIILRDLYPSKSELTPEQKVIIDKLRNIESNATTIKKDLSEKVYETHKDLADIFGINVFSEKDEDKQTSWFHSLYQKDAGTLTQLAQIKKIIVENEKQKKRVTEKEFQKVFKSLKKWSDDNKVSIKEAYKKLFQVSKSGIPSLFDKISPEFYTELIAKKKELQKQYIDISKKLHVMGYKGANLEKELKRLYETASKKWIEDNIDVDNFNKLYKEYYEKTKNAIETTVFDTDPIKNDIIKTQKLKDWVIKNDIFTSPEHLYYSEMVQPKEGVGESVQYQELKKTKNQPLLEAYILYSETNKRAFKLNMLSTYKEMNTFIARIPENRFFKTSPFTKEFWTDTWDKIKSSKADLMLALSPSTIHKNYKLEIIDQLSENGKKIPVSFLYKKEGENLSEDLHLVMYKWATHINSYETLSSFENRILSLKIVQKVREALSTADISKELDSYIDNILYNVQEGKGEDSSWTTMLDMLQKYTTQVFLGLNIKAMAANLSSGFTNLSTKPEWQGGGRKNVSKAMWIANQVFKGKNTKLLPVEFNNAFEFIKFMDTRYLSRHEDESSQFSTGFLSKSSEEYLLSGFSFTDHIVQDAALIANSLVHTIIDGKIVNIIKHVESKYPNRFEESHKKQVEIKKEMDKEIKELKEKNLMVLFAEGKLDVVNSGQMITYREFIKDIVKDVLGNMSEEDKSRYKLNYMYNKGMFLKNWLPRLLQYRMRGLNKNFQKNMEEEGTYRTALYYMFREGKLTMAKLLLKTIPILGNISQSIDYTKTNHDISLQDAMKLEYKRQQSVFKDKGKKLKMSETEFVQMQIDTLNEGLKEFNLILSVIGIGVVASLSYAGADDDDKWKWKFLKDLIYKKDQEASFFVNPTSMLGVLQRNLLPHLSLISNVLSLGQEVGKQSLQLTGVMEEEEDDVNARTSGSFKVVRKLLKVTPGGTALDYWIMKHDSRIETELINALEEKE